MVWNYSTGNVGIGTTSPGAQLNLAKTATTDVTYTGIKIDYDIQTPAADSHGLRIGSDINMGMSDGRDLHADIIGESVVINTAGSDTTSHTGSPVGVDITITNNAASDNDAYGLRINAGTPSTGNNYAIYSANTGDSYFAGNVGIGTVSPSKLLHLKTDGVSRQLRLEEEGTAFYDLGTNTGGDFSIIQDDTSTRLFIESTNGNVGIGTTSPASKLDVRGKILFQDTENEANWSSKNTLAGGRTGTIGDDSATAYTIGSDNSVIIVQERGTASSAAVQIAVRNGGTGVQQIAEMCQAGTKFETTTGNLTGTTGTNGKVTLSVGATAGEFYIENRLGYPATFYVTILGGTA